MKALMEGYSEVELLTPAVYDGKLLSWYQRRVLDVWMESGRYDKVVEAIRGNYKGRAIKKWLGSGWRPVYIKEEMRRRGYDRFEIERRLIRDIEKEIRMDEGQRDSLKMLAKIKGLWQDNQTNVLIGQTFDVRQGNGAR
jgi:hypothetical protein